MYGTRYPCISTICRCCTLLKERILAIRKILKKNKLLHCEITINWHYILKLFKENLHNSSGLLIYLTDSPRVSSSIWHRKCENIPGWFDANSLKGHTEIIGHNRTPSFAATGRIRSPQLLNTGQDVKSFGIRTDVRLFTVPWLRVFFQRL